MPEKIGVMGGSFDPIHLGHLRAAEEAVELLGLDRLMFIPTAVPPHKPDKRILEIGHRWKMLELAIEGNPNFSLSGIEIGMPGKSYTVNTLRKLHEVSPGEQELYFLVGLDAFLELDTWWHYTELFELAHMVALDRPGYVESHVGEFLTENVSTLYTKETGRDVYGHPVLLSVHYLKNTHLEISSTMIRRIIAEGRSIRYLVPRTVLDYIEEEKLYIPEGKTFATG